MSLLCPLVSGAACTFLDFVLVPRARTLHHRGIPVPLGSRAFDVLLALVCSAGQLISKEMLMSIVWPDTIVEKGNLRVQMSAIRKALGAYGETRTYIKSIPGAGYRFTAPVALLNDDDIGEAPSAPPVSPTAPPAYQPRRSALTGRDDTLVELELLWAARRHLSITGAAGIGKSVLAAALAERVATAATMTHCVHLMGSTPDLHAVLAGISAALRLPAVRHDSVAALQRQLRDVPVIVLLDDCDEDLAAAAQLAQQLRAALPLLWLLTTSRAPLPHREAGQQPDSYHLAPLATPPAGASTPAIVAARYPAIALLCARAQAHNHLFELTDRNAGAIVDICRQLDGNPLALELAAQHMALLHPAEFLALLADPLLADRFALLDHGPAGGLPRHRSMWAALEWSFQRLSFEERVILQRLSLFRDSFTADGAAAIVCCPIIPPATLHAVLAALVQKSLLRQSDATHYQFDHTVKAYASAKLLASRDPLVRRTGRDGAA